MAKVATQYKDEEEFSEFLEAVADDFHVVLDYQSTLACETLGDFEKLVYEQVLLGKFADRAREQIENRLLAHMNLCLKGQTTRQVQMDDMNRSQLELAREIGKGGWHSVYLSMCHSLSNVVPSPKYRLWSKVVMWSVFFGSIVWSISIGLDHGWFLAIAIWIGLLCILGYLSTILPSYAPEPGATIHDAFDRFIAGMEECHKGFSILEMQFRMRQLFRAFYGIAESDSVDAYTPFRLV